MSDEQRSAWDELMNSPGMQELRGMLRARDAEYDVVVDRLARDGITGRFTTTACPVQFEGTLTDGSHIYFRARWDDASLDVWDPGVTAIVTRENPDGSEYEIPAFDAISASYEADADFGFAEASWLEPDEAEALIRALVARHQG